jgi:hypothetical protein
MSIELYEPWYVSAPRPTIVSAPSSIGYGGQFEVDSGGTLTAAVTIVRCSSNTHSFSPDQRHLTLKVEHASPTGIVTVSAPPDGGVAPPGWYMLFIIDELGVPSIGEFTHIGPQQNLRLRWRVEREPPYLLHPGDPFGRLEGLLQRELEGLPTRKEVREVVNALHSIDVEFL